jgi:hypothetical protein
MSRSAAGKVAPLLREGEATEHVRWHEVRRERRQDVEHVLHALESVVGDAMLAVVLHGAQPGEVGRGLGVTERRGAHVLARRVVRQLLERPRPRQQLVRLRRQQGRHAAERERQADRGEAALTPDGQRAHLRSRVSSAAVARHSAAEQ